MWRDGGLVDEERTVEEESQSCMRVSSEERSDATKAIEVEGYSEESQRRRRVGWEGKESKWS